jgi:alkanesulfonate monooxygenase SsuD/methylene tetrahydromethanopterin reductase-like flavin-dependent oxidoreductase (luciferase family)
MRVGVVMSCPDREVAATARRAEEAGFDFVAAGEHLFFHIPTPNVFVTLAAAAAATQRIRLLSTLTLLPLYPPALAAKLVASLDNVSGGRFDFGVGIGGEYPPEFAAVGVPVRERGRRTDDALELMTALLDGRSVNASGWWGSAQELQLKPPATQRPHPPIWMGGRRTAAFQRAARFADHWLPYMYTPEQLADSLVAIEGFAESYGRKGCIEGAIFCWGAIDRDPAVARRNAIAAVSSTYQQDFDDLANRYLVTGTPDQVVSRLLEYRDAGARTVIFAGPSDSDPTNRTAELLAAEVLPALRG